MQFLDKVPMATVQTIAGIIIAIIAYVNNDISVWEAFVGVGVNTFGAGKLGEARNGAGRGLRGE